MYRLTPHSSDDDDRSYRTQDEVKEAKTKDPLFTFSAYLKEVGVLNEEIEKDMETRIAMTVDEATEYAEKAAYAEPEDLMRYVYEEKE